MNWIILITIAAFGYIIYILICYVWLGIIKKRAEQNINYTFLEKGKGKLVISGENVVKVLSNFDGGYFDDKGHWVDLSIEEDKVAPDYGPLFKETGIVHYGQYPIDQIYEFMEEFSEYVKEELKETKKTSTNLESSPKPYSMQGKQIPVDSFKQFYVNAIEIKNIEMKGETKVDMIFIITYKVMNIMKAIFKVKPDGIVLSQTAIATKAAIGDVMKSYESYQYFRDEVNKADQGGDFVQQIISRSDHITARGFGLVIDKVELAQYDLSLGEPGDEELEKSMKAKVIATNLGEAYKTKRKAEQEADGEYAGELVRKLGQNNAANIMSLQQIKETELKVYNSPVTPIIGTEK